jgi:orotidine-5'-phosphate decarboxylase
MPHWIERLTPVAPNDAQPLLPIQIQMRRCDAHAEAEDIILTTMSDAPVQCRNAADQLIEAMRAKGTCACVGIDPVLEKLPSSICADSSDAEARDAVAHIESFCTYVLDAVSDIVPVVKFQSACFERFGALGMAALQRTVAHACDAGLVVLHDAKRGDIGISAEHYASATFDAIGAHWITASPYLGRETLEPYVARGGVFVLVRTSNPGSDDLQTLKLSDGRTVAEATADMVAQLGAAHIGEHGRSSVGAVVGATRPAEAEHFRNRMPKAILLVPGIGAQGGTLESCRALCGDDGCGALFPASRSVLYAFHNTAGPWIDAIAQAAAAMADTAGTMAGLR